MQERRKREMQKGGLRCQRRGDYKECRKAGKEKNRGGNGRADKLNFAEPTLEVKRVLCP
jgi:hypothetical protein